MPASKSRKTRPSCSQTACAEVNWMKAKEVEELKRAVEEEAEGSGLSWAVLLESYFTLRMEGLRSEEVTSAAVLGRARVLTIVMGNSSSGGAVIFSPAAGSASGSS